MTKPTLNVIENLLKHVNARGCGFLCYPPPNPVSIRKIWINRKNFMTQKSLSTVAQMEA